MGGSSHQLADQLELDKALIIRQVQEEDDADFARLLSTVMAAQMDAEILRDRRKRWSQKYWFERVAVLNGRVVGILELVQAGKLDTATARIVVEPTLRGKGIGTALMKEMQANPEFFRRKVFLEVRDDDPNSLAFARKYGFQDKCHMFESTLDPSTFQIEEFQPYIDKVLASGIRFATVAELGDNDENRFKLWEIEHITDMDIPGIDPDQLPSWEDAQKSWYSASWYSAANEFVALDGDKWVGLSGIAELSPGNFYIQHTCTLREYRGRGIAMALKALSTEDARQRGARYVKTNNHSDNTVMLAINDKFGFVPQPGWFELFREPNLEGER